MPQGKAIVIAWPEKTARGDDWWYVALKKIGVLKNLNFRVGHAAIVLVNNVGDLFYYDFGRYITPRGMGRARSCDSDPSLTLDVKANFSDGHIGNLENICDHLDSKSQYTHGGGAMYFSIAELDDFDSSKAKADEFVQNGSLPYGAIAPSNSNCSRFVWSVYKAGQERNRFLNKRVIHETIMPSPISNVVNAVSDNSVFIYDKGKIYQRSMSRIQSFRFFINQITINFRRSHVNYLPKDDIDSSIEPVLIEKNDSVIKYQLDGLGESARYTLKYLDEDQLQLSRYNIYGENEYTHVYKELPLELQKQYNNKWQLTYDSHALYSHFKLENNLIKLYPDQIVKTPKDLLSLTAKN